VFCELSGEKGGRIPICGQSVTLILICDCSPVRGEGAVRSSRWQGKGRFICNSLPLPTVRGTFFFLWKVYRTP